MSDLKINNITNSSGNGGPVVAGVSTVSTSAFMVMPSGNTEIRGAGGGIAVLGAGYASPTANNMQRIIISTFADATDFGDMARGTYESAAVGSSTRAIFMAGGGPVHTEIQYTTFSSGGGANDFGDLIQARQPWNAGANDSVRGFVMGGSNPALTPARSSSIEVITMASTGNANSFGDLTQRSRRGSGCSSPTRAIHFTGRDDPARTKDIQFFTMATKGNAVKFGEATDNRDSTAGGFSSNTRGVFGGGNSPDTASSNVIEFITIASEGNATDFGDLTVARISGGGASSKTRGLFCGGYAYPGSVVQKNEIDFVTIATTANATDFGDLTTNRRNMDACSDSNGGIGE